MITLIYDPHALEEPDASAFVASEVADYIPLRRFIYQALNDLSDREHQVIIRSALLNHWVQDLYEYGPYLVRHTHVSLRARFETRFRISCPDALTDEAIKQLELLSLPVPYDGVSQRDPVGWLLGEVVTPLWRARESSDAHLAELAAWTVSTTVPTLLEPLMRERLREWSQKDPRYDEFHRHPWNEAGRLLLLRWALESYPAYLLEQLRLRDIPLVSAEKHVELIRTHLLTDRDVTEALRRFWYQWRIGSDTANIEEALGWMSGLSEIEFGAFQDWASIHQEQLTVPLIQLALSRFQALGVLALERLKRLEKNIPPPIPSLPGAPEWTVDNWLAWGAGEYLPYFSWVLQHKKARDKQMELGQRFGEWFVTAYPDLILDPRSPIVTNQLNTIFSTSVDVVLWLIVDGLTWWEGQRLSQVASKKELGVTFCQPSLSALPSITSISKRALVQGFLDPDSGSVPIRILLKRMVEERGIKSQLYTERDELQREIADSTLQHGVYVLLYNQLDTYHHTTHAFTDTPEMQGMVDGLVEVVQRLFERCEREGLTAVAYVSSDHGSTLLPIDQEPLPPPPMGEPLMDEVDERTGRSRGRSQRKRKRTRAYIIATPVRDVEISLADEWWLLRGELFTLPQSYLIPKKYAPVGGRVTEWTHGGPTPEETITPFIRLQPEQPEHLLPLTLVFSGQVHTNQDSLVELTVGNPNSVAVTNLHLVFPLHERQHRLAMLKGYDTASFALWLSPAIGSGDHEDIPWQITGDAGGRDYFFEGVGEVAVRRLQSRNEMDDLFGAL